jgi:hypothetical protein
MTKKFQFKSEGAQHNLEGRIHGLESGHQIGKITISLMSVTKEETISGKREKSKPTP